MDVEANPVQVQTPPKEDEIETLPEAVDLTEAFEIVENPGEEDEDEEEEEEVAEEVHADEIVVEDADPKVEEQSRHRDQDSSLSSAPGSEADNGTSKTRTHSFYSSHSDSKTSLSRFEPFPNYRVSKE
jgi:hypothetical protein